MFPSGVLRLDVKRAVSARNIKSREDSLPPALIRRVLVEAGTRDDEHPSAWTSLKLEQDSRVHRCFSRSVSFADRYESARAILKRSSASDVSRFELVSCQRTDFRHLSAGIAPRNRFDQMTLRNRGRY